MNRKIIAVFGFLLLIIVVSCQSEQEIEYARYYTSGSLIYQSKCQNCHGKNGEGLLALIPPLTDSVYLRRNKYKLACISLNGLSGLISVSKKLYDGKMPPAGLSSLETADVLTYITNSFGNKQGTITVEKVDRDLKNCK